MRDRDGSFDIQLHGEVKRIKKNGFSMFGSYKPRYKSLLLTCQKKRIEMIKIMTAAYLTSVDSSFFQNPDHHF